MRAERATLVPLGAGLSHTAYLVGDLVVRVARDPDGADLEREAKLLDLVQRRSVVRTPVPVAAGRSWMAYRRLPGEPLLSMGIEFRTAHAGTVGATLGAVLAALWSIPPADVAPLVEDDATAPEVWRDEAACLVGDLIGELPRRAHTGMRRFLEAAPPPSPARRLFSHNDLGCEHVLVNPASGRVTGILDWSDAAIVDPAKDLGLVLRDLGQRGLDAAVHVAAKPLGPLEDARVRALFYARCLALEDLAFGLETDQAVYASSARDAIARLFAA